MREDGAGGGRREQEEGRRTEEGIMPHSRTSEEEVRPDRGGSRTGRREESNWGLWKRGRGCERYKGERASWFALTAWRVFMVGRQVAGKLLMVLLASFCCAALLTLSFPRLAQFIFGFLCSMPYSSALPLVASRKDRCLLFRCFVGVASFFVREGK